MELAVEKYKVENEPYYLPIHQEVELFEAAYAAKLPVMLKGPTGCGKTRFVEYMAYKMNRPLITVACHEDLSATDLVGRFLLEGEETVWHDGPLTTAVRSGAICYLDEVVEARKDTVVIIHPLTDDRRRLPIEKRGTVIEAPPEFMLVVSYNPGYQSILKDLKAVHTPAFRCNGIRLPERRRRNRNRCERRQHRRINRRRSRQDRTKNPQPARTRTRRRRFNQTFNLRRPNDRQRNFPVNAAEVALVSPITDDRELQRSIREIVTTII